MKKIRVSNYYNPHWKLRRRGCLTLATLDVVEITPSSTSIEATEVIMVSGQRALSLRGEAPFQKHEAREAG